MVPGTLRFYQSLLLLYFSGIFHGFSPQLQLLPFLNLSVVYRNAPEASPSLSSVFKFLLC
jgi:hypothetical protein